MAGRGSITGDSPKPHPRVWALSRQQEWVLAQDPIHFDKKIAGVGPGTSFGWTVAESDPSLVVGLVPAAVGGSTLAEWMPGQPLYEVALNRARLAQHWGRIAGVLWHQGESDLAPERVAVYTESFGRMITQLRQDLGEPGLPVLVGEIHRARAGSAALNEVLARLPDLLPRVFFITSEGLTDRERGDQTHFDTPSQRELGRRYAKAWLRQVAPDTN